MTIAGRLTQFVSALASLSLATSIFAQVEQPLPPAPEVLTTTWFYWVLPLFATIIALTIGLNMHGQRVRATIETWPKADTSFSFLCLRSVITAAISFGIVSAIFTWIAFSPRTGDEWLLHRTMALSSIAVGMSICAIPWALTRTQWNVQEEN